jgi:hypothetical protein
MHARTELDHWNSTENDPNTLVATILSHRSYYSSHMSRAAPRGTPHTANLFHRSSSALTSLVALHPYNGSPSGPTVFVDTGLQSFLSGSPFQTTAKTVGAHVEVRR